MEEYRIGADTYTAILYKNLNTLICKISIQYFGKNCYSNLRVLRNPWGFE